MTSNPKTALTTAKIIAVLQRWHLMKGTAIFAEAADRLEKLEARCSPSQVRMIGAVGHYVSDAVAAEFDRLSLELAAEKAALFAAQQALLREGMERDAYKADALIMVEALDKLSRLGNEPFLGNSEGNVIAQRALAARAAQETQPT